MKKIVAIIASLLALFFTAKAQSAVSDDPDDTYAKELLKPGASAPDFTIGAPDGKSVRLSDFKGKYVVLDFWATWCPDCRADVPRLKEIHKAYASDSVAFLSVSFDTDKDKWTSYIRDNGMDWAHGSELKKWKETTVSSLYYVKWIPSIYLIGPDGKVILGTVVLDKIEAALKGL